MKKLLVLLMMTMLLFGCKSEEEKAQERKQELIAKQMTGCKDDMDAGRQPAALCATLPLPPEYLAVAQQALAAKQQPQQPQYVDPAYQQQPQATVPQQYQDPAQYVAPATAPAQTVNIQQTPGSSDNSSGSLLTHALAAGAGAALANHMNNRGNTDSPQSQPYYQPPAAGGTNVTKNYYIKQLSQTPNDNAVASAKIVESPKKPSAMDMTKLSAPIPSKAPAAPAYKAPANKPVSNMAARMSSSSSKRK